MMCGRPACANYNRYRTIAQPCFPEYSGRSPAEYPSGPRGRIANPLSVGSNPTSAFARVAGRHGLPSSPASSELGVSTAPVAATARRGDPAATLRNTGLFMPLRDLRPQAARRSLDEALAHLRRFELDLKFSAGIWYFSPPFSRFHEKYQPDQTIEQRLEIASRLRDRGLCALEAHYPNEINESNLDLWRSFTRDTGIRVLSVIPLLFWDRQFEWGLTVQPAGEAAARRH